MTVYMPILKGRRPSLQALGSGGVFSEALSLRASL
ncbi:hypothetical protein FHS22_001142 [Planomonospora venezuelensis]|uniref:Uncharacterized protein n=1 Tax=Planomonospora venezuelensis TaxID=1999 RepID=A0A841D108_PLAVE|nr:hypothetical protein [Planomonospora venezuelensis]